MHVFANAYRLIGWVLVLVALVLSGRLALVMAATPTSWWMSENTTPSNTSSESTLLSAVGLANHMYDTTLADVAIGDCVVQSASPVGGVRDQCAAAIAYGIAVNPASSAYWFIQARFLAATGVLDDRLAASLKASYATGSQEGWLAAQRLPFALRLAEFLPESLVDDIGGDVVLVVANRQLAQPLIAAYIADPFLREQSWPIIQQFATFDEQERLIAWIRQAL